MPTQQLALDTLASATLNEFSPAQAPARVPSLDPPSRTPLGDVIPVQVAPLLLPSHKRPSSPPENPSSSKKARKSPRDQNKPSEEGDDNDIEVLPAPKKRKPGCPPKGDKPAVKNESSAQRWHLTNAERGQIIEVVLGEGSKWFPQLSKRANLMWDKLAREIQLEEGPISSGQLKYQWERLLSTFKNLWEFRNFTGRGADADEYDWDDEVAVDQHIANSKRKKCSVDGLSAAQCKLWNDKGWYEIFFERFKDNPKVVRLQERGSGVALSDPEDANVTDGDDDQSSGDDKDPPATALKAVKTPKRARARQSTGSANRMDGMNKYFEARALSEAAKVKAEAERVKEKDRALRLDRAECVLASPEVYGEEVVVLAQQTMKDFFSGKL
ncbi:hypothetical protein PM082_019066 [Marasmius tenuissimus]|nr:hypothetical protein PM082_019066 [Marasmius tenuissimus]